MNLAIDRRELVLDEEEKLRMVFEGMMAGIWTAGPGVVQSFNSAAMTAVVQPSVKALQQVQDGSQQYVALPLLLDCPVQIQWGGGYGLTVPINKGDDCLVVFASRCIDGWWQSGGVQLPLSLRMHDLSDGFCIPGVFSQPRVLPNYSTTSTQLRNQTGDTYVEIASGGIINMVAPTQINMNTPLVAFAGAFTVGNEGSITDPVTINGTLRATGDVQANSGSISLVNHVHTGVQGGTGNTGPAVG